MPIFKIKIAMLSRTNIQSKLNTVRRKEGDLIFKKSINDILNEVTLNDNRILEGLSTSDNVPHNAFKVDLLKTKNIYHISTIQKICIDYRLRFLHSSFFKSKLPYDAILKIKQLEEEHNTELKGFKIMAPSVMFKLENTDDPLLFAPIGNGYYYLIHKWGNDLNPFRKILMWPFKTFENLLILIFLLSFLCTLLVPTGLFSKQDESVAEFILMFFFMFKAVAGVFLFYGFAMGKNFNTAIWNSKYDKA